MKTNITNGARFVHAITDRLSLISMSLIALMMVIVTLDIIGRVLFNHPLKGSIDLIEVMMGTVVFFSLAYCTKISGDARVDLLYRKLPVRLRAVLDCFTFSASLFVYILIMWRLAYRAKGYFFEPFISPSTDILHIPLWPFLFLAALGSANLCLELMVIIIVSFKRAIVK